MDYLLMMPGPVESPDEVIEAFNGQMTAHYGGEFRDLYIETGKKLSNILGSDSALSFIIPGSGSLALETIGATFCNNRNCLIINNGHFGDRIYNIANKYSSRVDQIVFGVGMAIDLKKIEERLKQKKYDLIWMIHVDSSVGVLNPVKKVAALSKKYQCEFYIDAVSSAAIEEIRMDDWGIDGIATASQKGFSCPAGIGMITINDKLVKNLNSIPVKYRSWYADLRTWYSYYNDLYDWHPYPVTIPTNTVKALAKSLEIIETKGIENRIKLHRSVSQKLINSIKLLGLKTSIPEDRISHGITSVNTLGKFDASSFINFIRDKYSILLGAALYEKMKPTVFRIGHMSEKQCETRNLVSVISALGVFMRLKKIRAPFDGAIAVLV